MGTQMMRGRDLFRLRELRLARGRELKIGGEGGRDVEDDVGC
jgi:hypothetical protein